MKITEIKLRRLCDHDKMKAVFSVTFDNELAVHDIRIIEHDGKRFIAMPSRKNKDGSYSDYVHPVTRGLRDELEQLILNEYCSLSGSQNPQN